MPVFYVECTYCGIAANGLDHVVPVSYDYVSRKAASYAKDLVVPCCSECNSRLSNFYLTTIAERAEYLIGAYKNKYKKILNRPDWTDEELKEMGPTMRQRIKADAQLKIELEQRLTHLLDVSMNESLTPLDIWDKYSEGAYTMFTSRRHQRNTD